VVFSQAFESKYGAELYAPGATTLFNVATPSVDKLVLLG
jgi:hypothetical protein